MSKINNVTQITLGVKSISIYKYAQDKHGNFMFSDDEVEVLGNIFENKELLKEKIHEYQRAV